MTYVGLITRPTCKILCLSSLMGLLLQVFCEDFEHSAIIACRTGVEFQCSKGFLCKISHFHCCQCWWLDMWCCTREHSPRVIIQYWLQELSLESFRSPRPAECIHKHAPKEASYQELSVISVGWGWGKGFSTIPVSNSRVCVPIVTERQATLKNQQ